ncbi:MAG TPA: MFS transporter [Chloroflexota bacterium]|nr:MFS transporter [Chloroflexota bacterium]
MRRWQERREAVELATGARVARTARYLEQGSAAFWRANLALFLGGWVTFACLYSTQPVLPALTAEFGVPPALASLSVSVTTATLAVTMLLVASLSDAWGRKPVMTASLVASGALALLTAFSPDFHTLLVLRTLQGVALAGFSAIGMTYVAEEIAPHYLGLAMGVYISGNVLGGMSGRLTVGLIADVAGWRGALGALGAAGLVGGLAFWRLLPPSAHFTARPFAARRVRSALAVPLHDPGLLCLYGIGFLLMGGFVTLYNYLGYQLMAPPYSLSQAAIGWVFLSYLAGAFSSTVMGRLADRVGRRKVLWTGAAIMLAGAALTLPPSLPLKIAGVVVFTFGFFAGHSIASSWVGRRALTHRAQASALYLFFYYMGSSIGGPIGGIFWSGFGWPGVVAMIAGALALALALSVRLAAIPPVVVAGEPAPRRP